MKKIGIIGGGILGMTLAYRLQKRGYRVHVFEGSSQWGGLCSFHDYGSFVWDKFYHCIMPQDKSLLALLDELGLSQQVHWTKTQTAYFYNGVFHPMSNNWDFLRFPLLSLFEKLVFGFHLLKIRGIPPKNLNQETAENWLMNTFGEKIYRIFWAPLLRSKFGDYDKQISASFFYSLLKRAWQARKINGFEKLGYIHGGYKLFFQTIENELLKMGAQLFLNHQITRISSQNDFKGCTLTIRYEQQVSQMSFDTVFFTGPTQTAFALSDTPLKSIIQKSNPTIYPLNHYLGVVCAAYVLKNNLTPYYLVNLGDKNNFLTGFIEISNLVDQRMNLNDYSLVYLPKYVDSADSIFERSDELLLKDFEEKGFDRLFPEFDKRQIVKMFIHKERFIQPLTLASDKHPNDVQTQPFSPPFQILNSAMILPSNLYNDAVIKFIDAFVSELKTNEPN